MIVSIPNSGTDWLASIIEKWGSGLRYYRKEFFNPICNPRYGQQLELGFGCELVSCYRNIGVRSADQVKTLDDVYRRTWMRENWNFDKENFSAFKVPWLAEHFELVFLYRSYDSMFPPSRLRVLAWYDAIYNALADADMAIRSKIGLRERARVAHSLCWDEMIPQARRLGAPILDYNRFCTGNLPAVLRELDQGWLGKVLDVEGAARCVLETRRYHPKR